MGEEEDPMNCHPCYLTLYPEARFCPNCGKIAPDREEKRSTLSPKLAYYANKIAGIDSPAEIRFKELFSSVFVKHTEEEGESLFLVGTSQTTPTIEKMLDSWPKPWLFARIFLMVGFLYLGLFIGFEVFDNANFFPGLIMVGSFIVPLTILIFFWEMNAPQNISIYKIIKILFMGGILSLVTAVFFYSNIGDSSSVIMVGIIEEVAKLLVLLWVLRNAKYKYILNGVLIGAAVGTGFAAFESAGYALMAVLLSDFETMYSTIFWRGVLAPGGHIVWSALSGAAIFIVKGDRLFHFSMLINKRFIRIFALVVAMHALWDLSWPSFMGIPVAQLCLTVFSWIVAFGVMKMGLNEISSLKRKHAVENAHQNECSNTIENNGEDV
jgi:protease PrsW